MSKLMPTSTLAYDTLHTYSHRYGSVLSPDGSIRCLRPKQLCEVFQHLGWTSPICPIQYYYQRRRDPPVDGGEGGVGDIEETGG